MQLLGTYQSNLTTFHYQQLLELLQSAIQQGDLASGPAYDQRTLKNLEEQANNFATLPTAVAGSRVLDEGVNYPLQLLLALYNSLSGEAQDFINRSANLVGIAKQETNLIDQILAADGTAQWQRGQIRMQNPWSFVWNFTDGVGKESSYVTPTDPENNKLLGTQPVSRYILDTDMNTILEGLVCARTESNIGIQSMNWSYASDTAEELISDDLNWTELTFQESLPAVNYTAPSVVSVYLPLNKTDVSLLSITGGNAGGALPTYLRLLFHPRRVQISATISDDAITNLSDFTIDPESVLVFTRNADGSVGTIYDSSLYTIDQTGNITPTNIGTNINVQIRFSENFPAYQCSLDLKNWSPVTMLDPERLYPDDAVTYSPVDMNGTEFPLTDESGSPSGLYFSLNRKLDTDYIFLIRNPGASNYGKTALLQLDVKGTSYLNSISLAPFAAFPATLTRIELEGLTPNTRTTIWQEGTLSFGNSAVETAFDEGTAGATLINTRPATDLFGDAWFNTDEDSGPIGAVFSSAGGATFGPGTLHAGAILLNTGLTGIFTPKTIILNGLQIVGTHSIHIYLQTDASAEETLTSGIYLVWQYDAVNGNLVKLFNGATLMDSARVGSLQSGDVTATIEGQNVSVSFFGSVLSAVIPSDTEALALTVFGINPYGDLGPSNTDIVRLKSLVILSRPQRTTSIYWDRNLTLRFPRQLVTKAYLTFVQENYTIVEYTPVDPTSLRRQTMNTLQSCLPFNVRRTAGPVLNSQRVYQYQIGFEDLQVFDTTASVPSVCSQDAGVIPGLPDIITFDATVNGTPEFWLSFIAYSSSGAVLDSRTNAIRMFSGSTYLFPFSPSVDRTQVVKVAVSITTVLRDSESSVSQYLLQGALVS